MALDREPIFDALRARLTTIEGIMTVDDRVRPWSQVSPGEQPAIFIAGAQESARQERGMPPVWSLMARLYVYAHTSNELGISAQKMLNRILYRIEEALEVKDGERADPTCPWATKLGGIVSHAWIEGAIERDEGTLGDQAVAVMMVEMLAAV